MRKAITMGPPGWAVEGESSGGKEKPAFEFTPRRLLTADERDGSIGLGAGG